jgi:hypothetical protein
MSEMLIAVTPGEETPEDRELLKVMFWSIKVNLDLGVNRWVSDVGIRGNRVTCEWLELTANLSIFPNIFLSDQI